MENTPGPVGYLIAWVVSVVVFTGVLAVIGAADGLGVQGMFGIAVVYGTVVGLFSIPFAVTGILLVHLVCRRVRQQVVHVVAAGAAGVLPLLLFGLIGWTGLWPFGFVPVATAIGRWSVVPLVTRRRRAAPGIRDVAL